MPRQRKLGSSVGAREARGSQPGAHQARQIGGTSADFPKFVNHRCNFLSELRKVIGTSNFMILVPLSI